MEGLSASTLPEMAIRMQAALRALSFLEQELVPRSAMQSQVDFAHLSHRSDAISKLTQSRAGALSCARAGKSKRDSFDRAPLSPLAEITNSVSRPFRMHGPSVVVDPQISVNVLNSSVFSAVSETVPSGLIGLRPRGSTDFNDQGSLVQPSADTSGQSNKLINKVIVSNSSFFLLLIALVCTV